MKIGLYNLEPKINNTAMMKVSRFHKDRGDTVEIYNHVLRKEYNKIYAFSLFDFTPKKYVTKDMVSGGTGFDVKSKLPPEIECSGLDYSIFPDCKTSYIWFSRGCIRNCSFCIVREKEGLIKPSWETHLNPNGEWITVCDNNFFANPNWREAIKWLKEQNQKVDFQGIDIRILTEEQGRNLNSFKHHKTIKFAWDNPKDDLIPKLKKIVKWIKPYKLMCYVLVGFNSTPKEDLNRINTLWSFGIHSFVMPYRKDTEYLKKITRWVNRKWYFKSCSFEEFYKPLEEIKA